MEALLKFFLVHCLVCLQVYAETKLFALPTLSTPQNKLKKTLFHANYSTLKSHDQPLIMAIK